MMKVGFYYSLLDWHHPDFEIDGFIRRHLKIRKTIRNFARPFGIAVR